MSELDEVGVVVRFAEEVVFEGLVCASLYVRVWQGAAATAQAVAARKAR